MIYRTMLERTFMMLCRERGPDWIESIIRPLRLPGRRITVRDIPVAALVAAIEVFSRT